MAGADKLVRGGGRDERLVSPDPRIVPTVIDSSGAIVFRLNSYHRRSRFCSCFLCCLLNSPFGSVAHFEPLSPLPLSTSPAQHHGLRLRGRVVFEPAKEVQVSLMWLEETAGAVRY